VITQLNAVTCADLSLPICCHRCSGGRSRLTT